MQLYGSNDHILIRNVGNYLRQGLDAGDGLLVIAEENHNKSIFNYLRESGRDVAQALRDGRLVVLDAAETLGRFMVGGMPDEALFQAVLNPLADGFDPGRNCVHIRAYGEMVGILWRAGEYQAAVRLEDFWNRFLESRQVSLFCAYPIEAKSAIQRPALEQILRSHTHVVCQDGELDLQGALSQSLLDAFERNHALEELRRVQDENARRDEELKRSHTELQDFAWAAAHDLKEPLRSVCSFAHLLANENESPEKRKEYADVVIAGVTRMSALLDDLLEFSSVGFLEEARTVDLNDVVTEVKLNLAYLIRETGTRLETGKLPVVLGHKGHLVVLFQHLLGNALKYRGEEPLRIGIDAERDGTWWILRVRDNGIGIAPEFAERIFGLFKRLHGPEIPGTGLGLALCRKIVEGRGGRIWVESVPPRGSVFSFKLRAA